MMGLLAGVISWLWVFKLVASVSRGGVASQVDSHSVHVVVWSSLPSRPLE